MSWMKNLNYRNEILLYQTMSNIHYYSYFYYELSKFLASLPEHFYLLFSLKDKWLMVIFNKSNQSALL